VSTEWFGLTVPSAIGEGIQIEPTERDAAIEAVIAGYEALMHSLSELHAPEFLEIAITMPQAKLLYLLGASGDLHMSDLVARLGVSLSTVSGLVDRIVDQDLASRREDPIDRRQVVVGLTDRGKAFIERFRDLNAVQMRALLDVIEDDELDSVRQALTALARAADQVSAASRAASRKDPA